jgi:hypothetical protein
MDTVHPPRDRRRGLGCNRFHGLLPGTKASFLLISGDGLEPVGPSIAFLITTPRPAGTID